MASLFFIVLGMRWAVVNRYGTDLPQWDQWDAEAGAALLPWIDHQLGVANFLAPHNEHRIVLTKLGNFILTAADGQWDQRLECAVNAILPAAIGAAFFLIGSRLLRRRWHAPLFLLLAALYALPVSWTNLLAGMHSAQSYLVILAFGAVVWLPHKRAWSPGWWLGAACAVLALGSLGTGFFAAAAVIAVLALRLFHKETSWRSALPALLVCALVIAIGCATRTRAPGDEALQAQSLGEFVLSVFRSLQWPSPDLSWAALVLWLPCAWLFCRIAMPAAGTERTSGSILAGLGFWVVLQIGATAYARGYGGWPPSPRYYDTLIFGLAVNGLAMGWLWEHGGLTAFGRGILTAIGLTWVMVLGSGIFALTAEAVRQLPDMRSEFSARELNTRNYLETGDISYIRRREVPYPDAPTLRIRLSSAGLRALLPESARLPLAVAGAVDAGAFIRNDSRVKDRAPPPPASTPERPLGFSPATSPLANNLSWGSYGADGPGNMGEWESAPLPPPLAGWLKFEVAGQPNRPGMALELRDAATRKLIATIRPDREPGDGWRSAYVRAPRRAFILVARDGDPHLWLAFGRPVEIGTLSYLAWHAVKNGVLLAEIAVLAAALLALLAWRESRPQIKMAPPPSSPA